MYKRQGEGVGSGVLIDNEGHIVTNNHVVSGASKDVYKRQVYGQQGRYGST